MKELEVEHDFKAFLHMEPHMYYELLRQPHRQKKTPILRQTPYGHRPVFGRSPEDVRTESVHVTVLCFR